MNLAEKQGADLLHPTLSAVICTLSREESLRDLLSDLLQQDSVVTEIIVVDQSPDHSVEMMSFLEDHRNELRIIRLAQASLPAARNVGLSAAVGDLVLFVDDDFRLASGFVRRACELFQDPLVEGIAPFIHFEGVEPGSDLLVRYRLPAEWQRVELHPVDSANGGCMIFRREAVLRCGGFDPFLHVLDPSAPGEDAEFTRRFVRMGFRLFLTPVLRAEHQSNRPGGCGALSRPSGEITAAQTRGLTYILLKENASLDRFRLSALIALARAHILRRDVALNPLRFFQSLIGLIKHVRIVRRTWRLWKEERTLSA